MPLIADSIIDVDVTLAELGVEIVVTRDEWIDALCPFHGDTSPSFSINKDTGGWICRHGGETGTIVDLVMYMLDVPRGKAFRWLVKASVGTATLLERLTAVENGPVDDMSDWAEHYNKIPNNIMVNYWFDRGFTSKTARRFGVRYDEAHDALVWPVKDEANNTVSFVRRYLANGPKRYIYPKSHPSTLFPLNQVDLRNDSVILVEGSLDAFWLYQCGVNNVLALLGSNLTQEHMRWLRGSVRKITVFLDNDETGHKATESRDGRGRLRGLIPSLAPYFDVSRVRYPRMVKDPQELSPEEIKAVLEQKISIFGGQGW